MKSRHIRWIPIVATALLVSACAGSPEPQTMPDAEPQAAPGPDEAEREALTRLYEARSDSVLMSVNEGDVKFMQGMISHHAQALVMAGMAPTHEASPEMRILTARIINAQKDEIAVMQSWLRDRRQHAPEVEIDGLQLMVDGEKPMLMHGMLSDEQLSQLNMARGPEWDRLFLEYMIMHHEGAVMMVRELFATDGATNDDVSFKLASDIQVDQITEIRRMKLMLEEMSGGSDR